jgi:hypothetical protein
VPAAAGPSDMDGVERLLERANVNALWVTSTYVDRLDALLETNFYLHQTWCGHGVIVNISTINVIGMGSVITQRSSSIASLAP